MKLRTRVGIYLGLGALLAATFLFRAPSLFEPPWYDDEGIYAAVAHALLRGDTLYEDVLDNRPPGIYWIYAAMLSASEYSVPFIKLIATAFVLLTQVTVFHIAWRLGNVKTGLAAVALLGFLGSLPLLEGNIANAEVFMVLPTALGVLLLLHGRFFFAGAVLSLAFLIKQVAAIEFVTCFLAVLLFSPRPIGKLALLAAGYAVPILLSALYLLAAGSLDEFVFIGFGYYLGYIQRATRIPSELWLLKLLLLATAILVVWWCYRGRKTEERFGVPLVALWTAGALYGVLFTSRPYPHYLLQLLPPLAVVAATIFVANWDRPLPQLTGGKVASLAGLSIAGCWLFLAIYTPWPNWARPEKTLGYYQNFALYVTGHRSLQAYNDFFDRRVNRNLSLVQRLRSNAKPGDYLLVWGEEPWLYVLSRLRVAPYTVSYYAYEMPSGLDRVVDFLQQRKPTYVVWTMNRPLYPKLKEELERNYTETSLVGNAALLQRTTTLTNIAASLPLVGGGEGSP